MNSSSSHRSDFQSKTDISEHLPSLDTPSSLCLLFLPSHNPKYLQETFSRPTILYVLSIVESIVTPELTLTVTQLRSNHRNRLFKRQDTRCVGRHCHPNNCRTRLTIGQAETTQLLRLETCASTTNIDSDAATGSGATSASTVPRNTESVKRVA
jgi:hypothetical protein